MSLASLVVFTGQGLATKYVIRTFSFLSLLSSSPPTLFLSLNIRTLSPDNVC